MLGGEANWSCQKRGRETDPGGAPGKEHGDNQFGGSGQQIAEADPVGLLYPEGRVEFWSEKDRGFSGRAESQFSFRKRPESSQEATFTYLYLN